ncbi:TRAP transporter large permease [Acidiphilium iwatense]|uniref:TRAP transporter large permease subunit n=1 Tax=Acidiphilium iwatense TaxID=768198 RepID=A0ABS9DWZ3_9PROT|nr:TRAP transporter large permease subunit [Acidiphilium iwatense]MCF3947252.1 TRAP transporter large permease subunit [Acidiphilium iwatense]
MNVQPNTPAAALRRLDVLVDWITQGLAAALVVIEIIILFAGIIWRYVLDKPLIWSNELAEILFLWLVSLGAVIALRRGEHMRMTVLVARLTPGRQRFLARIAGLIVAVFTLELIVPGIGYMYEQQAITTPTLHIPGSWEVAGQLVALMMLFYVALRQLFAGAAWRELLITLAIGVVIGLGLWAAEPLLYAIGNGDLVVFFVLIVGVCIFAGVPIAFAFGIATIGYIYFTSSIPLSIVISQMDQGMASIELLAVPMFVILGLLLEMTGIARALVDLLSALVGNRRGGLSYVLIGAIYLIAGISGSKAADQAAVAPVLLPEMKRRGTPPGELVAQLAAAAAMSETIPPSLVLIIVGAVTGVSTAALFTGGLLPAAVAALGLIILIFFRTRNERPSGATVAPREAARLFLVAIPALILPFLIRYAVLAGIATATEVATIGVVYAVLVGLVVYRCFDWRRVFPILVETAALSGAILLIIGAASAMAWALTQAGFAQTLTAAMTGLPGGKYGFMAVSILLFIVLGSVLEGLPAMVLFGPLLFPIAGQVGINVIQYAIVSILAMGIGLFSPPFGVGFYQTCLISKASSDEALGRIWPYMATLVVALIVVAAVPWISTGFL